MTEPRDEAIATHLQRSLEALARAAKAPDLHATVRRIADACIDALANGGKILLAGNGGAAADAQHIATELLVRYRQNRAALAAIALTTDTSALTAIGNDFGFDKLFERQVRGLGRKGDVLIGLSSSGRSPNVLAALKAAREMGLVTVGFTSAKRGDMPPLCDLLFAAPSEETAIAQQIHMVALHAICDVIERDALAKSSAR